MAGAATFEELGATPPPATDLTKVVLEGDDVPEALRGKTAAELIKYATARDEALRISEQAREDARRMVDVATRTAPASAPATPTAPTEPEDLTEEQLRALVQEDPAKAIILAMAQTKRKTTREVEARMAPLVDASASSVEAQARQKYASDFATLGPEIDEFIKRSVPEGERAKYLGNMQAWDMLIPYVRGMNTPKLIESQVEAVLNKRLGLARDGQRSAAAPNLSAGTSAPVPADGSFVWDSYSIDILEKTFGEDTPANRKAYLDWKNKGRVLA